jgi:hypothetical protein
MDDSMVRAGLVHAFDSTICYSVGDSLTLDILRKLDATLLVSKNDAEKAIDALQAFKDYVHQRLDAAGVPTHPEGTHSAAGCRVGDRLDIALDNAARFEFIAKHLWQVDIRWNRDPNTLRQLDITVRQTCESSVGMQAQFTNLIDDMRSGK